MGSATKPRTAPCRAVPSRPPLALPATLIVPGTAVQLLNANHRVHWRVRHHKTKYWLGITHLAALSAWGRVAPQPNRVRVVVTFSWPDKRRRDVGYLAPTVMACVDALVLAGVLEDDSDDHILGPDIRRAHGPFSVEVRLEPIVGGESA